jgi:hypothetical protein
MVTLLRNPNNENTSHNNVLRIITGWKPRKYSSEFEDPLAFNKFVVFALMASVLVPDAAQQLQTEIRREQDYKRFERLSYKPGRQLHYVPLPRQQNPRQHQDDGEPFLGRDVNLTPAQHRERARQAYATKESESPTTIRGREQAAAKSEAEAMRGNTHSETHQLEKLFVVDETTHEIDWVKTRDARRSTQRWFERRRAVSIS